jgi:5-methylcytosine-specific restriction endonuclease McrA
VNAAAKVVQEPDAAPARATPRSAGRFAWQLTADQEMQDLFEEARELIGHEGDRDLTAVLKRGLRALVETLRKTRYAATSQPREAAANANGRHVPRAVVRAVVARDGGRCTFKSPDGRRCTERMDLQLDHVIPFARGGKTVVSNLRQLCSAHNQYEAERVFGEAHMREQREAAQARGERARAGRAEADARARGKQGFERQCAGGRDVGVQGKDSP